MVRPAVGLSPYRREQLDPWPRWSRAAFDVWYLAQRAGGTVGRDVR